MTKMSPLFRLISALLYVNLIGVISAQIHNADHDSTDQKLVLASDRSTRVPRIFNFAQYLSKFHKNYGPLETLDHFKLFSSRTMQIFLHNVNYAFKKTPHYLKQNEFTDMTAEEVQEAFVLSTSDLPPVNEAIMAPDMPADDYHKSHDKESDGFSQSGQSGKRVFEQEPSRKSVGLDFFSTNQELKIEKLDPVAMIRKLSSDGELEKSFSGYVELENERNPKRRRTLRQTKVVSPGPDPKTMNINYDPSLIPSQAGYGKSSEFSTNFANLLMDDISLSLDPYPTPKIPVGPQLSYEKTKEEFPTRGSFIGLIRDIYSIFSLNEEAKALLDTNHSQANNPPQNGKDQAAELAKIDEQNSSPSQQGIKPSDGSGPVKFDIDWRRTGCISEPKHQRDCNACYVLAPLSLLEFLYCRQTLRSVEFSEQYVIDCGFKANLEGCRGGKLSNVGIFVQKYGLQLRTSYPFVARQQECPYGQLEDEEKRSYEMKPNIVGWKLFQTINAWYELLPKSPLIVGINMPADFLAYGGSIHDGQNCLPGKVHAMVLVGSGIQDGNTFWLLKNTFSTEWGEGGYFRLSKKAPLKCFDSAILANARF